MPARHATKNWLLNATPLAPRNARIAIPDERKNRSYGLRLGGLIIASPSKTHSPS